MKDKGYSAEYAVGVTIASAIQGVVVPPSHNLVLYSIVAAGVVAYHNTKFQELVPFPEVPAVLEKAAIYLLDMGALLAGT